MRGGTEVWQKISVRACRALDNLSNACQPRRPMIAASKHTRNLAHIIITVFLFTAAAASNAPAAVVTADGFQLKLNGQPFVIKGMNYSPVPIGTAPGFVPYGDYFIPYYTNVWKPDVDNMRAAGINVIKLYAGNPDLNAGAHGTAGNWRDFLD